MMRQTRLPHRVHKTLQEMTIDLGTYRRRLDADNVDREKLLQDIHIRFHRVLSWSRGDLDAKGVK